MRIEVGRIFRGFTLPVVLVAMTGLLVLLLGLVTIVGLERRSSKAHADGFRAELAARSALSEVKVLLSEYTANDEFVVFNAPIELTFDDNGNGEIEAKETRVRPYPFIARAEEDGGSLAFGYEPLFSASGRPDETDLLEVPDGVFLPSDDEDLVSLRGQRWEGRPVVAWRNIENDEGKVVARYAYWLEDTEAFLDPGLLSSNDSTGPRKRPNSLWPDDWSSEWPNPYEEVSDRFNPPWPAPGLNPGGGDPFEPLLAHAGAFTINDPEDDEDNVDFDDRVFGLAGVAPTRGAIMAGMDPVVNPGADPNDLLRRDTDGHLLVTELRQVEENFTAGNEPYDELALVPPVAGVDASMVGERKLNLNALLADDREGAVDRISSMIANALPEFGPGRKGGFHEDYERTLAASILDYADEDTAPTFMEGVYRGVDSYPMINEVLTTITFGWRKHPDDNDPAGADAFIGRTIKRPNGRVHLYMTVELFVEVWNMSSHTIVGEITASYDEQAKVTDGGIAIGGGPSLGNEAFLGQSALSDPGPGGGGTIHEMTKEDDGRWYFAPKEVELEGNEHRVIRMGAVKYRLDIGDDSLPFVDSLDVFFNDAPWPECRLRWNGELVDWAREMERLNDWAIPEGKHNTVNTLGSSYGVINGYYNGNGDIRHSYYVQSSQNVSAFPANHSPHRRNVRYQIYNGGSGTPWGRVLPSEWGDGGHDATFGYRKFNWVRNGFPRPDDQVWGSPPEIEPDHAPSKISNMGRFYSETELGNIYDPAMWSVAGSSRGQVEDWAREWEEDVQESAVLGGGNTLRIGRPEHELFSPTSAPRRDREAARLLDLFHAGVPLAADEERREGDLVRREGHVNINTAPRDVLRALLAGKLATDPLMGVELARHDTDRLAPRTIELGLGPPRQNGAEADAIADAIIEGRPFASVSEVANLGYKAPDFASRLDGVRVAGNKAFHPAGDRIQWSDSAAEEAFARLYNSTTVRSRNYKVHVIGQAVRDIGGDLEVLSTRRKVFKIFCDPGDRDDDGEIDSEKVDITVIYEKNS